MDRRKRIDDFTPTPKCHGRQPINEWLETRRVLPQSQGRKSVVWGFIKKAEPILSVILWGSVIFYFSGIPGLKSDFKDIFDLILRKTAHISEYIILTILLFRVLSQFLKSKKQILIIAMFLVFVFAVSDEIHQLFIFDREGKVIDVLIDTSGIFIAFLLMQH